MHSVTNKEKWSYAIGNMPFSVKDAAFSNFVVFYYTQVQGVSGTLAGLAFFLSLSFDALSDPIVGSWSDSIRSRLGRRHPVMIAGAIPTALLFLALFVPPEFLSNTGMFVWLLVVSILLRTSLTFYFIPFTALGAELSTNYDERTVIAKARVSMGWIAAMALPAVAFAVLFPQENGVDGRLVAENYVHYGQISALVAFLAAFICIAGTWSVIPRLPQAKPDHAFSWVAPFHDMKRVFGNRNFRFYMGATLSFGVSAGAYTALSLYIVTYFWEFSTQQLAGVVITTALGTLAAFLLMARLGQRFDKPVLLAAASIALAINCIWFIGARLMDWLPANGDAVLYGLLLLNNGIAVFTIVGLQAISASLTADIVDEHEVQTEQRQEGVMFAAGTFVQKATIGIGTLLAGVVIDLSGVQADSLPGQVEPDILFALGSFTLLVTATPAVLAAYFNSKIRLGRAEHSRIRAELSGRSAGNA